jgi:aminopeptidase YwaD
LQKVGAAAVIVTAPDRVLRNWDELARRGPGRTEIVGGPPRAPAASATPLIFVRTETLAALVALADGQVHIAAPRGEPAARTTYNVLGVRHGAAGGADHEVVLLSAHYDHLGVRNGVIFHGANDDASGTAAVMEFARILGKTPARRRTAYFALFGCEEEGGLGAQYFLRHTPPQIGGLTANLEFEMIGVDDPKHPGFLMLTGWDRSNLGPTLATHGARIGPDPYPEQHFFQRSDNYQLALQGVIAQTVSAWPVPPTYHAASDDLAHVDLAFMDRVIGSMVTPVTWLLDSDFVPAWNPGQKP